MNWRLAAALGLLLVLAAVAVVAFAADRGGEPQASPASPASPATAIPSPTPSPTPTSTPSPSPELVLPANDVDDPLEAIRAIEAYRDYLFEHPDPDLVRFIYHPECGCVPPVVEALSSLVQDRRYIVSLQPTRVVGLELLRAESDRSVVIEYHLEIGAAELRSRGGVVIERDQARTSPRYRVSIARSDGGRWLVTSIRELA